MMHKNKIVIIITMLMLCGAQLFAQVTKTVTGTVTDESGDPLAGVVVIGDEGDVYATTDTEGKFSLQILFSDVMLIEKEGYISEQLSVNEVVKQSTIVLSQPGYLMGEADMLELPFRQLAQKRTTGSVSQVNVNELQTFDARQGLGAAISGRVSGVYGSDNIWGRGDATIVVDGIPRNNEYAYSLREIESITVLKDPLTRSMYGASGDKGVIMITTKRGKAYKKELNFQGEYGISTPKAYAFPEYMDAGDYMETYNSIYPETYSATQIQETRDGINPAFNPDLDFYSDDLVKSQTEYFNIYGEASGGNKQAQYYLNMGWEHNQGWMNVGDQDTRDRINIRGNVDYMLTDNFKMKLDAVALFDIAKSPNITDYWSQASTVIPNAYPFTWNPAIITDPAKREETIENANLVDGMLLGGSPTFTRNTYGDLTSKGNRTSMNRNMQVNVGADWDLKNLLPGLKSSAYISFDFYNSLVKQQNSEYAVYNPLLLQAANGGDSIGVQVIGEDVLVSNYSVENDLPFHRRVGMYANLSYDKKLGETDVSFMAVAYRDQLSYENAYQQNKNLTFGLSGNVMHKEKYLLDFSAGLLGSQKLEQESRYSFAPSLGLGWILTEEDFMEDVDMLDFLKLRGSAGILKNDNWDDYFLYSTAFNTGGWYNYNNGENENREMNYNSRASNIAWQKRKELVIGFDASMFEHKLWVDGSVFYTERYDLVTELENLYPLLLGTRSTQFWGNYESDRINGFELGIKYKTEFSNDVALTLGSNFVGTTRKQTQIDEPVYPNDYQYRTGTATNSFWGLATDGLYGTEDFDAEGNLVGSLPTPSWGSVAPGDIKYIDKNGDGKVNSEDVHAIGKSSPDFQYSLYFNLKVKQFELYALGVGQTGDMNMRNGDYFRTYGNLKYPEHLKQRYSSANPDVNAIYPRLTSTKSSHNFQNSEYWMYKNNRFNIPVVQLTYTISGKPGSVVNNAKLYLRGTDVVTFNKNEKYTNVNVNSAPKTQSFAIGCILSF